MYYFRWYSFEKHVQQTADHGYLITEWLHRPDLSNNGVLPDAAPFHLGEARWLHNPQIAEDYAKFWISPDRQSAQLQLRARCQRARHNPGHRRQESRNRHVAGSHRQLQGVGRCISIPPPERPILADRHARRHGEVHRRRRLPHAAQQLHARRRARHRRTARLAGNPQTAEDSPPRPTTSSI